MSIQYFVVNECCLSLLSNLYCSYFGYDILSMFLSVCQLNTAMAIKISVFWDVTPCSFVDKFQHSSKTSVSHYQKKKKTITSHKTVIF